MRQFRRKACLFRCFHRNSLKVKRVFLIDDQPEVLRLGSLLLERVGLSVSVFQDPTHAMNALADPPDAVLVDLKLDGLNAQSGVDWIVAARRSGYLNSIYAMSAARDSALAELAKEKGATGWIQKPLDFSELRRIFAKDIES